VPVEGELLGIGTGQPGQRLQAGQPPIVTTADHLDLLLGVEVPTGSLTEGTVAREYEGRTFESILGEAYERLQHSGPERDADRLEERLRIPHNPWVDARHRPPEEPMTGLHPQEQQPEQAPASQSYLAVTARYHWLTLTYAMFTLKLFVNGYELPARWGRNVVPMPPGQHTVQLYIPYFLPRRIGPAETTVTTTADQVVELEYRAPAWFVRGSLGPPPQQHNGLAIQIGVLIALLVILCLCCGVAVFADA
jgi:hypothetical protein